jgi:hypothetical protein
MLTQGSLHLKIYNGYYPNSSSAKDAGLQLSRRGYKNRVRMAGDGRRYPIGASGIFSSRPRFDDRAQNTLRAIMRRLREFHYGYPLHSAVRPSVTSRMQEPATH